MKRLINKSKIAFTATTITLIIMVAVFNKNKNYTVLIKNLALENIEALANEEEDIPGIWCFNQGSIDCPSGGKWEYVGGYQRLFED